MLSPMTTVFVLAVLWLIVVVPMIVRRNDERRRERRWTGSARAMRALGRRAPARRRDAAPRSSSRASGGPPGRRAPAVAARRPVPAAQEALMYPVDRSEMSAARPQMMARRRRSLGILVVGAFLFTLLAVLMGGMLWLLDAPFLLGPGRLHVFLRTQALRDRERRANRQQRADRAPHQRLRRHRATSPLRRGARVGGAHRRRRHRAAQHGHDRPHRAVQRGAGSAEAAAQRRAS